MCQTKTPLRASTGGVPRYSALGAKKVHEYRAGVLVDKVDGVPVFTSNVRLPNGHEIRVHDLERMSSWPAIATGADVSASGLGLGADRASFIRRGAT